MKNPVFMNFEHILFANQYSNSFVPVPFPYRYELKKAKYR